MRKHPLDNLRLGLWGKGGAGKSTVAAFLAAAMAEAGYAVLVLDADSTNHGLAAGMGMDCEPDTLLEHFGGMVFSGGPVTCPVDDPRRLPHATLELRQLPCRFVARNPDGVLLTAAGKLGPLGPGAGCDGPVAKIARDLRVTAIGPHPVTLIDFKAGFEDAARGALATLDWAVVVVDPTLAALQVARDLAAMVADIRRGVPPATRHLDGADLVEIALKVFRDADIRGVAAVLNRAGSAAQEAYLRTALESGGVFVAGVLPVDSAVADQWLHGQRLRSEVLLEAARALLEVLEQLALAGPTLVPA